MPVQGLESDGSWIICIRGIDFELCFYDIPIRFWNCSNGVDVIVWYLDLQLPVQSVCLPPQKLWVWTPFMAQCTRSTLCEKVYQWLATCLWFSSGNPNSSTNKTNCHEWHDITEILLKVPLNTRNQPKQPTWWCRNLCFSFDHILIFILHFSL